MNVAIILGRLTRDPAIKVSQSGMTIARFTLAVNRLNKKGQNPEADFINCVAFGKTADAIGGEKKFTTEISVNRAEFIEKRSESSTQGNSHAGNHNAPPVGFEQMGTEVNDPQWMEQEDIPF